MRATPQILKNKSLFYPPPPKQLKVKCLLGTFAGAPNILVSTMEANTRAFDPVKGRAKFVFYDQVEYFPEEF